MKFFFYSKILTNVITWSVLSVKTHPSGHGSVTGVLITSVTFFTPYNVTMHEYEQMHTHTVMTSRLRPTCSAFLSPVQKLFSIHFTLSLCERPLLCTNRRAYWCWSMHRDTISTNHSSWTMAVQEKNCICKKCRLPSSSFQHVPKFTSPSLSPVLPPTAALVTFLPCQLNIPGPTSLHTQQRSRPLYYFNLFRECPCAWLQDQQRGLSWSVSQQQRRKRHTHIGYDNSVSSQAAAVFKK